MQVGLVRDEVGGHGSRLRQECFCQLKVSRRVVYDVNLRSLWRPLEHLVVESGVRLRGKAIARGWRDDLGKGGGGQAQAVQALYDMMPGGV